MKHPLRRSKQKMPDEQAIKLLQTTSYGILATVSQEGQPYGVPLNHCYHQNHLYFHCAPAGHKLENIRHNPNVSFTVVGDSKVMPEKFTTHYSSVIAFGTIRAVTDPEEITRFTTLLCERFTPELMHIVPEKIAKYATKFICLDMEIDYFSGKMS